MCAEIGCRIFGGPMRELFEFALIVVGEEDIVMIEGRPLVTDVPAPRDG